MDLFQLPVLTVLLATCAMNPSRHFCNAAQSECISKPIARISQTSEANTSLAVRSTTDSTRIRIQIKSVYQKMLIIPIQCNYKITSLRRTSQCCRRDFFLGAASPSHVKDITSPLTRSGKAAPEWYRSL